MANPNLTGEVRFIDNILPVAQWELNRVPGSYTCICAVPVQPEKLFADLVRKYKMVEDIGASNSKNRTYSVAVCQDILVEVNDGTIELWVHETKVEEINDFISKFTMVDAADKVKWFYMDNQRPISMQLNLVGPNPKQEFYPWLDTNLQDFAKAFMESTASVLLLLGPPGTGKTSFIRYLIRTLNFETWITYDPDVQQSEAFYLKFAKVAEEDRYGDDTPSQAPRLLVMEDADVMLESRGEGNKLMTRLLNLADGLVAMPKRKIIFSTNLPGLKNVDDALLRPGRCFAAMRFRELTSVEAEAACKSLGKKYVGASNSKSISLATALNGELHNTLGVQKIGFT